MSDARQSLKDLLGALGESSQFVSQGSLPPVLPGLNVQGAGLIGLPVSAADAKRLIAQAEQAPYGRGEKTILDTNVRRVWQLDPSKFTLENRGWDGHVAAIVDAVRQDLGIAQKVKAVLYKLLVYGGDEYSGADMGEVYDESITLDHWRDPQGRPQPFGEMCLEESEILNTCDKEDWACRQEIEEASGNAGVSMERWYRQGVIVLWPRDRTFRILAAEGQKTALPELEKRAARAKRPETLAECRSLAAEIVAHWRPRQQCPKGEKGYPGRMLQVLERIGATELVERFVADVLPGDYDGSEGQTLLRLCEPLGWRRLAPALCGLIARQKPDDFHSRLDELVALCKPLFCDPPPLTDERRAACTELAAALAEAVERWDKKPAGTHYGSSETRKGVVDGMVRILAALSDAERLDWLVTHVVGHAGHYDLRNVLISEVTAIYGWLAEVPAAGPAAQRLLEHCRTELRAATAEPVQAPADWAREADLGCKCADCRGLAAFLRDPALRVGRFPLRKDRRQHLHGIIDGRKCDCTHVTERKGSPQTLVCTKTQASYERRLEQFNRDLESLRQLETLSSLENPRPARPKQKAARTVKKKRKDKGG